MVVKFKNLNDSFLKLLFNNLVTYINVRKLVMELWGTMRT